MATSCMRFRFRRFLVAFIYRFLGSEFTIAIDKHGSIWGWGRNDQCQLGFESIKSSSKSPAGKVLTIERANRERRTITLPPDNSAFVGTPTRLHTLTCCTIKRIGDGMLKLLSLYFIFQAIHPISVCSMR